MVTGDKLMLPGIDDLQLDDHNEIPDCAVGASSSPKGIGHTALFFSEDGKYSTAVFMDAFKAVCADKMACLLPRFLIYCCCTSTACKLNISPLALPKCGFLPQPGIS